MMRPSKRDEIVRQALKIFYRQGFHATGMDRLVAETGISKTSMYNHFATKDELIAAALELRDKQFRHWLFGRMAELAQKPDKQLLAMFDALAEWFQTEDFRGCMFVNAAAEFPDPTHPARIQALEHKQTVWRQMEILAKSAGAKAPDDLASTLMVLKEGAIVSAQLLITKDPAGDARKMAEKSIRDACQG